MFAGIFILSAAVLIFEMSLIRIFSVVLSPGLSFFGITVAMFGVTIGGILAFKFREYFKSSELSIWLSILSSAFSFWTILFALVFFSTDPHSFSWAPFLLFSIASIPFIAVNTGFSMIFLTRAGSAGKWYAADLAGAGSGVVLAVILMNYLATPLVMVFAACLAILAGGIFYDYKKPSMYVAVFSAIAFITLFAYVGQGLFSVKYSKFGPEQNIIYEQWNSFSRITLAEEYIPTQIISMPKKFPQNLGWEQYGIYIDSDAYTPVMGFDGDFKKIEPLRHDLSSAIYSFMPKGKILIIGVGGGRDVLTALMHDWKIRGIDINPIIVNNIMGDLLKNFTNDLYGNKNVEITVAEGRSFVQKDKNHYDVINLPLVDTWASTINGNLSLVESYLYTSEAFEDYLSRLNNNGVLTVSRWVSDGDRLVSLFYGASRELGITDPEQKIAIISRTDGRDMPWLNNYLFKKTNFTPDELKKIKAFAAANGFVVLAAPKTSDLPQSSTDDRPFFFFNASLKNILKMDDEDRGGLGLALYTAIIFSLVSVLLPLGINRRDRTKFNSSGILRLSYFAILGIAFMLIEIGLIQKFILYLEYPVYSYSLVLAVILVVAGIGSSLISRLDTGNRKFPLKLSVVMMFFSLLFYLGSGEFMVKGLLLPLKYKMALSALAVSFPALMMGMFLPAGIKKLEADRSEYLVPWAWAINGAASILASVGAVIFAIIFGFSSVILVGSLAYLLAAFIYYRW